MTMTIKTLLATAILLAGPASAFVARSTGQKTPATLVAESFDNEIGVTAPLGLFDPLGFLKNADAREFNRLRFIELKHGRIVSLLTMCKRRPEI